MKQVVSIMLGFLLFWLAIPTTGCIGGVQLTSLEITPSVSLPYEEVIVSATLSNTSNTSREYTADLVVNGTTEKTQKIVLGPRASQTASFSLMKNEPATYVVQLGMLMASFTVLGVGDLRIVTEEVEVGQSVTVSAEVQNLSDAEVTYNYSLVCESETCEQNDVVIGPGATEEVTCNLHRDNPGIYHLELLGLPGSFKVLKPAEFQIRTLSIPDEIYSDQPVRVTVDVTNSGEVEGSYTAALLLNDSDVGTATVNVTPGSTHTMSFVFPAPPTPGSYTVNVAELKGILEVLPRVFYEENFDSFSFYWVEGSFEDMEYYNENGEYHLLVKSPDMAIWSGAFVGPYEDFALEVDARLVTDEGAGNSGLVFGANEDFTDLYVFTITTDGRYGLYLCQESIAVSPPLIPEKRSPAIKIGNDTNHLKVVCQGSEVELYVNGTRLDTFTDESITRGYVGVMAGSFDEPPVDFAFDNFALLEPY